ncbi:hypothetical protein IAR50_006604 [Cryptococcus sp. DSM 104548]
MQSGIRYFSDERQQTKKKVERCTSTVGCWTRHLRNQRIDSSPHLLFLPLLALLLIRTIAVSLASACFRMVLTPIDMTKTTQQTQVGKKGRGLVRSRVREGWGGQFVVGRAGATAAATVVGRYPRVGIYNHLSFYLPLPATYPQKLIRQAFIGFSASLVSDTSSSSLRVHETYRQTHPDDVNVLWKLFANM